MKFLHFSSDLKTFSLISVTTIVTMLSHSRTFMNFISIIITVDLVQDKFIIKFWINSTVWFIYNVFYFFNILYFLHIKLKIDCLNETRLRNLIIPQKLILNFYKV